jgi:integrase
MSRKQNANDNAMFDTREEKSNSSPVGLHGWRQIVQIRAVGGKTPNAVNSRVRPREYLTVSEVERLMAAARKRGRYGHRDATMILIAFRHGLRASELCDLHWHQVELPAGRLHVRRAKSVTHSKATKYALYAGYSANREHPRTCSGPNVVGR